MAIPACLAILRYPLLSFDESVLQDVSFLGVTFLLRMAAIPLCLRSRFEKLISLQTTGFSTARWISISKGQVQLSKFSAEPLVCR